MTTLSTVLRYEMFFLLAALAVIVFYRLLTGKINTDGLLAEKAPNPKGKEPNINAAVITPGGVLLTGKINTEGLVADKAPNSEVPNDQKPKNNSGVISPSRIQMLVATFLLTIYIVMKVVQTNQFPDIPNEYLWALGGSHGLYLAGKVYGMLKEKLENAASRMAERSKQ